MFIEKHLLIPETVIFKETAAPLFVPTGMLHISIFVHTYKVN